MMSRWLRPGRGLLGGAGGVLVAVVALDAQEDFRNTDAGRPIRVEDAYPIKFLEWEWQSGATAVAAEGEAGAEASLELKVGFARNWQVAVEVPVSWERASGVSETGIEAFGLHVLYNLNQEGRVAPAFALRGDLESAGVGSLGNADPSGGLMGILTKSFGRTRVHFNGGKQWSSPQDGRDAWQVGIGLDNPVGLSSAVLMGDVFVESPDGPEGARVWGEIGSRVQVGRTFVLDVGLGARLDRYAEGEPNLGVTIGLARAFGVPALTRVPRYPNPRIS